MVIWSGASPATVRAKGTRLVSVLYAKPLPLRWSHAFVTGCCTTGDSEMSTNSPVKRLKPCKGAPSKNRMDLMYLGGMQGCNAAHTECQSGKLEGCHAASGVHAG